jgi:hypothetical protein
MDKAVLILNVLLNAYLYCKQGANPEIRGNPVFFAHLLDGGVTKNAENSQKTGRYRSKRLPRRQMFSTASVQSLS